MRFDFERFYQAVNAKRTARAASWRQVAREVGIGKSTLARMSQNKRPDADGLAALSFWAELNPADFVFIEELVEQPVTSPAMRVSAASDDCPAARGGVITAQ
jgi:transcriptional regulator with XRE-family HTH domain